MKELTCGGLRITAEECNVGRKCCSVNEAWNNLKYEDFNFTMLGGGTGVPLSGKECCMVHSLANIPTSTSNGRSWLKQLKMVGL